MSNDLHQLSFNLNMNLRDVDFADFSAFADFFFLSASNLCISADFRSFELSALS